MIAVRLVRLIEAHCDELAHGLLDKFQSSPRTSDLRRAPAQELLEPSREVLHQLSEWLTCKSASEMNADTKRWVMLVLPRAFPFSDFCWAMVFTK
jgi:hypothetical protein